jgi:sugar/nucleoside kinase (ribokinase family)
MKIGIIGTINRDTIRFPDGTIKEGWGGILYNIVSLSRMVGKKAGIFPVCRIGQDCYEPIMEILGNLPGVKTALIKKVRQKNNHCFLTYRSDGEKTEILKGGVTPLIYDDIHPLMDSDIILLNFISGNDINVDIIGEFRRRFRGIIYIDIHSFTLGRRKNGSRFLRKPPGWEKVVDAADYVQMNRTELAILTGAPAIGSDGINISYGLHQLYNHLRLFGIDCSGKVFIITDGSRGCFLSKCRGSEPVFRLVPSLHQFRSGDVTGCGDCFSAGFIAGLARTKGIIQCGSLGNSVAVKRLKEDKIYLLLSYEV